MDEKIERDMERRLEAMRLIREEFLDEDRSTHLILKAHLIAEYLMEGLITVHLGEYAGPILDLNLSFYRKLHLVAGYDLLPHNVIVSLRKLNNLRNKCVHTLGLNLTRDDILVLFEDIESEMPFSTYDEKIKVLMLRYIGWISGYLAPKTWISKA